MDNSRAISWKIKDYELDLGLAEAYLFDPEIQPTPWLKDEMVIVCHARHRLS